MHPKLLPTKVVRAQIDKVAADLRALQVSIRQLIPLVRALPRSRERDQYAAKLIAIGVDPEELGITSRGLKRGKWTALEWAAEAIALRAAARDWARAGRHDKAAECEAEALKAEEVAAKLKRRRHT